MMKIQTRSSALQTETRRSALRRFALGGAAMASAVALSACGFKLRGSFTFAFRSLQVTGLTSSPVSLALQDSLSRLGVAVGANAPSAGEGDAVVLNVVTDQRERTVVNQTASGQVRELLLRQRFRYSLSTRTGRRLLEESELVVERNITFSESSALAKASEEKLVFEDIQSDAVQQVQRRLSSVKNV